MPCTLLIFARDDRTPYNVDRPQRGYAKGGIVTGMEGDGVWGAADGPPDFIRLTISDRTLAEVEQYRVRWDQLIDFRIDAHNVNLDRYDITLFAQRRLSDGLGGITREQVEDYLAGWNISVTSASAGNVSVRFRIRDVASSRNFFKADVSAVVFSELSYDQGTGEHVGRADYSATSYDPTLVEARIARCATVVAHDTVNKIIDYSLRVDVLASLKQAVRDVVDEFVAKRRWYFDSAAVDDVLAAGGFVTRTAAQVMPFLKDALAD